jgi:NADH:ubiquinone oxidoreductase subunit E
LIPLLQQVQGKFGYVSEEAIFGISDRLGLPAAEVFGVLTFYAQFRLTPTGKHNITLCRGTACHVRGATAVRRAVQNRLGIQPGETTADREYTLETVACIGACALAPTLVMDGGTHGLMTPSKVNDLLAALESA